jgi:hypothetical protein
MGKHVNMLGVYISKFYWKKLKGHKIVPFLRPNNIVYRKGYFKEPDYTVYPEYSRNFETHQLIQIVLKIPTCHYGNIFGSMISKESVHAFYSTRY